MTRRLWVALVAVVCTIVLFSQVALAAPTESHRTPPPITPDSPNLTYCNSDATCDNKDAFDTGCANDAVHQGAAVPGEDTSHLQIYWSPRCHANYAYVIAPNNQQLNFVELDRATTTNDCNHTTCSYDIIQTCNVQVRFCAVASPPNYLDPNSIPVGGTTWQTNMWYAPTRMVRVVIYTNGCSGGCQFSSAWH
jgi:hypothetical protein